MTSSLFAFAVARLSSQKLLASALAVGLLAAVTLAVTIPLMQAYAAESGLQATVHQLGRGGYLEIQRSDVREPGDFTSFQWDTSRQVAAQMGTVLAPAARYASTSALIPLSINDEILLPEGRPPVATYYEGLQARARLVAGSWPADSRSGDNYGASVTKSAARDLALKLDDVYCVYFARRARVVQHGVSVPESWCSRITAIWEPKNENEPYWAGTLPNSDLMLGQQSFFAVAALMPSATIRAGQFWTPVVDHLHWSSAAATISGVRQLRGTFNVERNALFVCGLDKAIGDFTQRMEVSQVTAGVVGVALIGIAVYSIAFIASHFLDAQRESLALLRSRGWSRSRTWALLSLQLGLLALICVPIGIALAFAWVELAAARGLGEAQPPVANLVAAVLPTVAATLAVCLTVLGLLALAASRWRVLDKRGAAGGGNLWWRWRNLDLLLAAGSLLLLGETRVQAGRVQPGDPFNLVLPLLALALLALAALRLLPLAARLLALRPGLAGELASWQLSRQPAQHARIALLLSFTMAVGIFASVYGTSDRRNAIDRAGYAAGADLRLSFSTAEGAPPIDEKLPGQPGVGLWSKVYRGEGRPGRSDKSLTLLGIDGSSFSHVAWARSDLASQPLDRLTTRLGSQDPDGLPLPGRQPQMSLWVYSSGLGADLAVRFSDAAGNLFGVRLGSLGTSGWRKLEAPLPSGHALPLRLRGFRLSVSGPASDGDIALSDLSAAGLVQPFDTVTGWWQASEGSRTGLTELSASDRHPRDGRPTTSIDVHLSGGALNLEPPATGASIPALISSQTLSRLGLRPGQTFPLHVDSSDVQIGPVDVVDYFPTLYPDREDFVVVPWPSLLSRLARQDAYSPWPNEAWIRGSTAVVAATLRRLGNDPSVVTAVDRRQLESEILGNPLRLSLESNLNVGFAAALAVVAAGFGLHFLLATRRRVSEYAILRANGLPESVVRATVMVEQGLLLAFSGLSGVALGGVLASVAVPLLQLGTDSTETTPPTTLHLEPATAIASILAVMAGAGLAGLLARRLGGGFDLLEELRSLA